MRTTTTGTRGRHIALCALLSIAVLGGIQQAFAGWMSDPPFLLGDGKYPDVARGASGDQVHVTWIDSLDQIKYRYYNGSTWGATEDVPMNGVGIVIRSAPDIWADSGNVPHIVWGNGSGHLYYTSKSGGSWGTPERIVENPDVDLWFNRDVRIAVASDGKRHVIWRRNDLSINRAKIYHMLWSSGSWGSETQVSEGTQTSKRCHLFLSPDNAAHIVWRQKVGPNSSYEAMYRKWSGGSFQPVITATWTDDSCREDPHVATDLSHNPVISLPEADNVGYIEWTGGGFSDVEVIGVGEDPVIAVDDNGAQYIFWEHEYSVDIGSGWSTPETYVAGSDLPDVIGGTDRAHIVYRNNNQAFYVGITAGGGPPPPDTTITVSSPNGGEVWQVGTNHNITWYTTGSVDEVDIAYSTDGGSTWSDVATGIVNQGYYDWMVPSTPSNQCRVRVRDAAGGDPSDTSDGNFTITDEPQGDETLDVSSPNGGEWWQVGAAKEITWDSSMNFTYVKIDYSTDGGATWIQITSRTSNDGSRSWTVPNTPSDSCLVRIMDWADDDPYDESNAVFTIGSGDPPAKSITVYTPNGGEILEIGSPYAITWGHTGSVSDVAIHYSTNNGQTWELIAGRTVNDHERSWTVPDVYSDSCLIRVMEADTGDPMDISDGVFSITDETPQASLTLLGPVGGEVFLAGGNEAITWESAGVLDSVQLQYSIDDGQAWLVIESTHPNTGSYSWTVPEQTTSLARVKVLDVVGGEVSDESDSTFFITDDVTAPEVDSVYLTTPSELVVEYSEPVDEATATSIDNYTIDNDVTVMGAELDSSMTVVRLQTGEHSNGVTYTLTINDVDDRAMPPNTIAENTQVQYELVPSGIGDDGEPQGIPRSYGLSQNYPNPFNPQTSITFAIPERDDVSGEETVRARLAIYNLKGRMIKLLFEGDMVPGYHTVTWNGRDEKGADAGSGIYFYRLEADSYVETRKMILVK